MTKDDILNMAKDAGAIVLDGSDTTVIERFASLIAEKEREECARVCDRYANSSGNPMNFSENCAQAIRARSKDKK
jgi:spore coat polysaccharide biosynthesis protein SpsF (cytidylyltransferase family)